MYKKIIFLLSLTIVSFHCFAQPKGFRTITDLDGFKKKFIESAAKTTTIKAQFVQEKNLEVLSEKITSKGSFLFKKPNMVRMEYAQPFKYLLIINKDKILVKDAQKTNSFSSKNNKLFEMINKIVIDCVQGTAISNKDFKQNVYENDKSFVLALMPQKKELKEFFSIINIYIDKKEDAVFKIDMQEPSGDNTLINFTNRVLNANVPDTEFTVN